MPETTGKREAEAPEKKEKPPAPVSMGRLGIELHSIEELYRFGSMVLRSRVAHRNLGTKHHDPSVDDICAAVAFGLELGLGPMQAATSVLKIREHLTLGGDVARGLVEAHPSCEWIKDNAKELAQVEDWKPDVTGIVTVKRLNKPEVTRHFSVRHAMEAGLWNQDGPWKTYKARMMYYRPLGFALRDSSNDILKGLVIAEELRDYPDNGPISGGTLPAKDLDEVAETLEKDEAPPATESEMFPDREEQNK